MHSTGMDKCHLICTRQTYVSRFMTAPRHVSPSHGTLLVFTYSMTFSVLCEVPLTMRPFTASCHVHSGSCLHCHNQAQLWIPSCVTPLMPAPHLLVKKRVGARHILNMRHTYAPRKLQMCGWLPVGCLPLGKKPPNAVPPRYTMGRTCLGERPKASALASTGAMM